MTLTAAEIAERTTDERMRAWRKWRRSMRLTIAEAAGMLDVGAEWLNHLEVGGRARLSPRMAAKLDALMVRWDESKRPAKKLDGRSVQARALKRRKGQAK